MSCCGGNVRVKLDFGKLLELWPTAPSRCWCLIDYKDHFTIADLVKTIVIRYRLPEEIYPTLILDGCILPNTEYIELIRDNDEICVVHDEPESQRAKTTPGKEAKHSHCHHRKEKKKKHKRTHSEMRSDDCSSLKRTRLEDIPLAALERPSGKSVPCSVVHTDNSMIQARSTNPRGIHEVFVDCPRSPEYTDIHTVYPRMNCGDLTPERDSPLSPDVSRTVPEVPPVEGCWSGQQITKEDPRISSTKLPVPRSKTSDIGMVLESPMSPDGSQSAVPWWIANRTQEADNNQTDNSEAENQESACNISALKVRSEVVETQQKSEDDDQPQSKKHKSDPNEAELSALDLAIKRTLENIEKFSDVTDSRKDGTENKTKCSSKKKRKRIRKRKSKDKSSEWTPVIKNADSFHSSSFSSTSTPAVTKHMPEKDACDKVVCTTEVDWDVGYKVTNYGLKVNSFGAKHVTFNDSEDEEDPLQQEQSQPEPSQAQCEQSQKQTEQSQEQSQHNICQMNLSVDGTRPQQTEEPIEVLRESVRQNNKEASAGEESKATIRSPRIKNASSPRGRHSVSSTTGTNKFKNSDVSHSNSTLQCNDEDVNVKTFQKGPFANVKVFNRKRNKNLKKASFVPLSKEEQLNTVATNISCIYQNTDDDVTFEVVSSEKTPDRADVTVDSDVLSKKPDPEPEPEPRDYSQCPILHDPPAAGDDIAYKVIEMNERYCPVLSNYKEAQVLSFDSKSQMLEMKLMNLPTNPEKKRGRFDLVFEDDEEMLTDTELNQTQVSVEWSAMVDTCLLTENSNKSSSIESSLV